MKKIYKIILPMHVKYLCTMQNEVSFALMLIFKIYVKCKIKIEINIFYNFDFQVIKVSS